MAGFDPKAYRASQSQQFSGTEAKQPIASAPETSTAEKLFQPFSEAGLITSGHEEKSQQSFARKVGEDALLLGLAPAALGATAVDLLVHPIRETKKLASGVAGGYLEMFDPRAWKEHPLLNTVNTIANVSVIGSIPKTLLLNSGRRAIISTATEAAIKAGVDTTIASTVFKPKRALSNSFNEAVRLKSPEPLVSALRKSYAEMGLAPEVAEATARQTVTESFGKFMADNGQKLSRLDAVIHPLSALGATAKKISTPVGESLFGKPEQSAVGKLYGSDVVKQDLSGFGMVEEWASMQTKERGLSDSVPNRVRIIQEWVDENPEYAALTPLERNKHFAQYAEADLTRAKFSAAKNREYVLTKALPENVVQAMQEFVASLPKLTDDGQPMTVAKIIESLGKQYERDFGIHEKEVLARMKGSLESTDKTGLIGALKNLGDSRVPISLRSLTKPELKLVQDLEGSGYRIGRAPNKTKISQAVEVTGKQFSKEDLVVHRTTLGRLVDKFGLSPEGVVEGTQFFAFREAFTQGTFKNFGKRTNIVMADGQKFPLQSLSFTLERLRQRLQQTRSGVLPGIHTIADLRVGHLVEMGFKEADAKILDKIIRESNVASPSITGLGEAISNYLRTRDNLLSRSYEHFLRWQSDMRFKKNPMFGIQAAVESLAWGSLFTKDLSVIGSTRLAQSAIKQLSRIKGLETPLKNSIRSTTLNEEASVMEHIMGNYNRQVRDAGMSPEVYAAARDIPTLNKTGVEGFTERRQFIAQSRDSNIWLGAAGFSNVKLATNMMRSYAGRFGMTLDEALAYKVVDGKKVYQNQWLVENMQDAAQGIFGYKTGVLTSPLIRTLNTVFFPIRFQTKTVIQTAKWLESLSPASRLAIMNSWTSMAAWLATDEGQEWKNKNRGKFASFFNYAFAYEGIGKTVEAVTRGKLFGGNTGLIGGLPFGFIVNIARDLGYVAEDEQINTSTGKPFKRTVVKDAASFAGFVTVVEDIILSMSPSMPFYTATGGEITVSLNRGIRTTIEQGLSALMGGFDPNKESEDYQKELRKSKKNVKPGFSKLPLSF